MVTDLISVLIICYTILIVNTTFLPQVDDTMWKKSPATVDLARSGQRTLWCHTPQVIHSGLLGEAKALHL